MQSPPGQTSQVYHDLRGILFDAESNADDKIDDASLQAAAAVALEQYNTEQLVTATLDSASKDAVIICQAGQVPSADEAPGVKRYIHPKAGKTFLFDHIKRTVSDVKDAKAAHKDVEEQREALEKALEEYIRDRYPDGVSSVFAVSSVPVQDAAELAESLQKAAVEDAKTPAEPTAAAGAEEESADKKKEEEAVEGEAKEAEDEAMKEDDPVEAVAAAEAVEEDKAEVSQPEEPAEPPKNTYAIHHVGNRFNLSNFWSGRWRASYLLDPSTSTLTSTLSVQVHYFENGNVQLNAAKPRTFTLASSADSAPTTLAKEVAKVIAAHEDGYQKALEESYDELAERAFKALRRQLPLTRQKVDWDKVLNYKLGDELSRA